MKFTAQLVRLKSIMSGSSAVRRLLPVSKKQLRRSWRYINAAVSPVHFNNPSPLLVRP
jgi:hypothetical protein